MQANKKYTALELLAEAGFEKPEDLIGKFRVVIGGISGIVKPDHKIRIIAGTKEIDILVGQEVKKVVFDGDFEESIE